MALKLRNISKETVLELVRNTEIELASTHTKLSLPIIYRIYRKMLANYQLERISWVSSSASIIIDWETVSFDEHDWDTPEEIDLRNRQDASYNDIPLANIIALLE